ncbi:hypothetical protein AURDEDRAFT_109916 [Auricularia subglabra TFB-10046 SS5]|nr:hypothetical protein AURDEDRAFT_109916 [Auricularia subglabra TFB-10046 SS5]
MFAGFLALLCIRRVFVHRVGSSFETADDVLSTLVARSSRVIHLELKDCLFNAIDLALLLSAPVALRTFVYEAGNRQLAYCDVRIHDIRACLEQQKDSLEDLWLDDYDGLGIALTMKAPMPSISTFTALRRLRISSLFVMGREGSPPVDFAAFLPAHLQHLHLTRCEARFEALRSALQAFLPQPRRVCNLTLEGRLNSEMEGKIAELYHLARRVAPQMSFAARRVPAMNYPLDPEWPERKWGMDEDITWAECQFNMLRRLPSEAINLA